LKSVEHGKIMKNKSFFYIKLLEREIIDMFKNDLKTNFMIEIDQKSSSSVFLSLILGNKKLSEKCNLNGIKNDPARYLMLKSENFFKKYDNVNKETLEILKNNRQLHKKIFMCYCYNQRFMGRLKILVNEFKIDEKSAKIISKEYNNFINCEMDDLKKQLTLINNMVKYVVKRNNEGIILNTLDGCKIKWKIYMKDKNRVKKKYNSYHMNIYNIKILDVRKIIAGFLPNLIHSIDGAVMRIIISEMLKRKYIINHLHDSIQCNPNKLDEIYDIIKNIYSSDYMKNILEKCFITPMRNSLIEEDIPEFDNIYEKYNSIKNEIVVVKDDIYYK